MPHPRLRGIMGYSSVMIEPASMSEKLEMAALRIPYESQRGRRWALRRRRRRPQRKVVTSPCLQTDFSSHTNVDAGLEAFEVVLFLIPEIEARELSSGSRSGLRPGRGTSEACALGSL